MANVIKTVYTYPLDGTTTDFAIPFEYLSRKFVVVTLIGQDRKELVVVTDYRFATRNLISTTKAWGPADNYQQIEIRRYTSASERLVDFSDGSILRATDLNVSQIQTLHVAEEARDLTADTIGVNNDGNLDGRGRRIVNVADGVDSGDVVTVGQMNRWSGSAADSANKAKVSETNAKTSETNSKASENAAKTSETNSAASEVMAQKWANNPRNTEVTTGKFSALHWSESSKDSATAADSSQSAAASSATASSNYATTSKDEADRSKTEADRAKTAADKLEDFNTLTDRINSVAVSQVGHPEFGVSRKVVKPGTVFADGQLLSRAVFPVLWAIVNASVTSGELPVCTEAEWQSQPAMRGCYTLGTDITNFRVPDYNGVTAGSIKAPSFRGDGGGVGNSGFTIGRVQASSLPNIRGRIASRDGAGYQFLADELSEVSGAFEVEGFKSKQGINGDTGSPAWGYSALNFEARRSSEVYADGMTEARVNSNVVVWVIRTHGVVNNPGSVDAAVLASRVEQVYTELNTRINNDIIARMKSGQRYRRNVFTGLEALTQLVTGRTVTLSEPCVGKLLDIGSHSVNLNPSSQVFKCPVFIMPEPGNRMHLNVANWTYTLEFPAVNQITLYSATGNGVMPINYIDVISDYPQT